MIDFYDYILFWVCIVGLSLGSFYNVVILRSLSNESIVFPPSKCPKCGNKLLFWHNIPILSYILLRGKCYFCKEKISIQYPIIELLTMLLFAFSFLKYGFSYITLFVMFWLSCLIIMTVTDIKEKLVDCNIAILMAVSGVIYNFIAYGKIGALYAILGLVAAALILELIARSGYIFAGTRAMGEADTYVAGALGAVFGKAVFSVLFTGFILSMFFVVPIFFYHQYKNNNKPICIAGILFILSVLLFKTVVQNYFTFILVLILGILCSYLLLKGLKKSQTKLYLPYVPALAAGALYFFFF